MSDALLCVGREYKINKYNKHNALKRETIKLKRSEACEGRARTLNGTGWSYRWLTVCTVNRWGNVLKIDGKCDSAMLKKNDHENK